MTKLNELLEDRTGPLPVWVRPPKKGNEYFSGFSRSKLYVEAGKGHIRSVSIREPGQTKGTRLFELKSILEFIERIAASSEGVANEST